MTYYYIAAILYISINSVCFNMYCLFASLYKSITPTKVFFKKIRNESKLLLQMLSAEPILFLEHSCKTFCHKKSKTFNFKDDNLTPLT